MESDVLKAVEEISGYTPDEMIAMYDDYERMAKEWEAYAALGTVEELAALKEQTRWIPVSERLPAVSEYRNGDKFKSMDSNELVPFLVCCEDTEIPFRAFYDGKNWGDGWGKQNVTHWQPLPQPPQKGE